MSVSFVSVLADSSSCPGETILVLEKLLTFPTLRLLPFMDGLAEGLRFMLNDEVPRKVQALCKDLWLKMNSVLPRKYVGVF